MKQMFILTLVFAVATVCIIASIPRIFSLVNPPRAIAAAPRPALAPSPRDEGPMPDLGGAIAWLNSPPLDRQSLRGKVVLVDIWTYSCINRLRQFPYVMNWAAKYKDAGLLTNTKRSRSARRIIASIDRARFALNATWAR